jgi:trehalose-phosphatase
MSGRDLADVRRLVGVPGIVYAGSHGFDVIEPDGTAHRWGTEYLPDLDRAGSELATGLARFPGARVERKAFAIAVHYRQARPGDVPSIEEVVGAVAAAHPRLRRTSGKKVFELRPNVDWDKGRALEWLLETLALVGSDVVPIYLGDDETDEDAFSAIGDQGLGLVVRGEGDDRSTRARFSLRDTEETRAFLELLLAAEVDRGRP